MCMLTYKYTLGVPGMPPVHSIVITNKVTTRTTLPYTYLLLGMDHFFDGFLPYSGSFL